MPLKSEFARIRQTGKMYDSPFFGILISFDEKTDGAKAAFVVSKKIDKRSTVRHEVKRKLALAVSSFLPRLPKHVELVFLPKQKAISALPEQLKREVKGVLKRAKLL